MHYEWTEMAFLELQAADTAMVIFGLAWSPSSWCWPPSTKAGRCRWP